MVIEKTHKAEDGTIMILKADSEEELARWDLEALTMFEDASFKKKVEDDSKFLEDTILKSNRILNQLRHQKR